MLRLCVRAPCRDEWEPLAGERGQVSLEGVRRSGNVCSEDSFFFAKGGNGSSVRTAGGASKPNQRAVGFGGNFLLSAGIASGSFSSRSALEDRLRSEILGKAIVCFRLRGGTLAEQRRP